MRRFQACQYIFGLTKERLIAQPFQTPTNPAPTQTVAPTQIAKRLKRKLLPELFKHRKKLLLERARLFFNDLDGLFFFFIAQGRWSSAFWVIVKSISFTLFPTHKPGRDGFAINHKDVGDLIDGITPRTQQNGVSACPSSMTRMASHDLVQRPLLLLGKRLDESSCCFHCQQILPNYFL